jgi:hypothetical protein
LPIHSDTGGLVHACTCTAALKIAKALAAAITNAVGRWRAMSIAPATMARAAKQIVVAKVWR